MAVFTALLDANVLYPSELRSLLMHLALTGLFRAKWTNDIHEEWMAALLEKRPDLSRQKLARTRALMDLHAIDALVSGYEDLIPDLHYRTRRTDMSWPPLSGRAPTSLSPPTCAIFLQLPLPPSRSRHSIRMNSSCIYWIFHPTSSLRPQRTIVVV